MLEALNSFKPTDEFEGTLISRMIALHFQSMTFLRRLILDDQTPEGTDLNVNGSTAIPASSQKDGVLSSKKSPVSNPSKG